MSIQEISLSIINRLNEDKTVIQPSIGRADVVFEDDTQIYWVIRNERIGSSLIRRDIKNNFTGSDVGQLTTSSEDEFNIVINRDSPMGWLLIKGVVGKNKFKKLNGEYENILINSISFFEPTFNYEVDAKNGYIKIKDEDFSFKSLIEEIKKWQDIEDLKIKIQDKETNEALKELLRDEVKQKEEEFRKYREAKKRYIIESSALRDQPILDPIQEDIKRSQILNGKLILTGGPGTGKTTSMVQRITFLTSNTIEEYKTDLSKADKNILFDQTRSWIFFSPSELLRHYLKDIMIKEGLEADNERVVVWELHRKIIFRQLGLINPDTQRPFQATNNTDEIFTFNSETLNNTLDSFYNFYVKKQVEKINKITSYELERFDWKEFASEINTFLTNGITFDSIIQFIPFYEELYSKFYDRAKILFDKYLSLLENNAAEIQISIEKENLLSLKIEALLRNAKATNEQENDDILEEDTEEIIKPKEFNLKTELNKILKRILRKNSLNIFDNQYRLTPLEKEFFNLIENKLETLNYTEIGQYAIFRKSYYRILRGFDVNVLSEFPLTYKQFRRDELLKSKSLSIEGIDILKSYISDGNKRLHKEEMDLVLLIILKMLHLIYDNSRAYYRKSTHAYIKEFNNIQKVVVAIDEATDFSILELTCMSYICNPKFRCVTLSGDLMQRLEDKGIKSWSDYQDLFKDTILSNLSKSYRQTEYLLDIAKRIYLHNTNDELDIVPAYPKTEIDPKPLIFINSDFEIKIEWITKRILEIHTNYGNRLPSIAVFLNDDEQLIVFEKALNLSQIFEDNDIKAEACPSGKLGDSENVRLFNIKQIKGMEFEAVFYIDLDKLETAEDNILDRYLYVGVSRASFYLAITVTKELPHRLMYLNDLFFEETWE